MAAMPIISDQETDNSPVSKSWFLPIIFLIILVTLDLKGGFTSFFYFLPAAIVSAYLASFMVQDFIALGTIAFVKALNQAMP
jgi:hypothetical protein